MPFDPRASYFDDRLEFDRDRMLDMLAAIRAHRRGSRVLDLAAAPYILDAALLADGCDVTLNGLPFEGRVVAGTATLTVGGESHECRLDLFDVETDAFPYANGSFDIVVAGEIFEHLFRQPWHLLAESWRCLADGGMLVMSTPNAESLERLYGWLRRRQTGFGFNPKAPTVRHAREYGPAEIESILESQGFDVLDLSTPSYVHIASGFPGFLGPFKRALYRALKRRAAGRRGLLANRGDSLLAIAAKNANRSPAEAPAFMLYAVGDARSGYNFPAGVAQTLD